MSAEQEAARQDAYRGAQQDLVVRGAGFLSVVGGLTVLALLPFYPPTRHLGSAGWILTAVLSVVAVALGGLDLFRLKPQPSTRLVYLSSFSGIVQLAFLQWLAGGGHAPYVQLLLLPTLGAGTSQSPRRCGVIAVVALAAAFSPALYSHIDVGATATEFAMVAVMSLMTAVVVSSTRVHRARLMDVGEHAQLLAHVDPLTGLPNRRAFDEALQLASEECESGTPISLVLCDVDSFKEINDAFGHDAGDELLRLIADALSDTVRKPDAAFRWAGDEFAVLLRGSDESGATLVAARIRESVSSRCWRPDGASISLCTGVGELRPGVAAREVFVKADQELLRCKLERVQPGGRLAV